jgi:hypothetical protein
VTAVSDAPFEKVMRGAVSVNLLTVDINIYHSLQKKRGRPPGRRSSAAANNSVHEDESPCIKTVSGLHHLRTKSAVISRLTSEEAPNQIWRACRHKQRGEGDVGT